MAFNAINSSLITSLKLLNSQIKWCKFENSQPFLWPIAVNLWSVRNYRTRRTQLKIITNDIEATTEENQDFRNNKEFSDELEFKSQLESGQRLVPKTHRQHVIQKRLDVEQPEMPRLARVAIVGTPNAGKSTLTNQLVGHRVSSVSTKVHTTRHKIVGIIVEDDTQIEFLDTPGLVSRKHCTDHKLEPSFVSDPQNCSHTADIIAVLTDVSNVRERQRLNPGIIKLLAKYQTKESILILNKIDKIKEKRKLLDVTTRLTCGVVGGVSSLIVKKTPIPDSNRGLEQLILRTEEKLKAYSREEPQTDSTADGEEEELIGWPKFSHVFMTSALTGDGVQDIRQYLLSRARFKPWIYHQSQVTNQDPHELVLTTIRQCFLDLLYQEIPYKLSVKVTMWNVDPSGNLLISADVLTPQKFMSLVIGPKGKTISTVVQMSRQYLTDTFHCDVSLKLIVKGINHK